MATAIPPVDAKGFLLYLAASTGDVNKVLDFVRRQGVILDTKSSLVRCCFDFARQHGDHLAIQTLKAAEEIYRSITEGEPRRVSENSTSTGNQLLESTNDPRAQPLEQDNLLVQQIYESARFGDLDMLQFALSLLDADINHTTADGLNALKMSIRDKDRVALSCLLSSGAKIDEEVVQLAESIDDKPCLRLLDVCRTADEK